MYTHALSPWCVYSTPALDILTGYLHSVDWSTGMECWNGALEWSTGVESWTGASGWAGVLDWSAGLECWTGVLEGIMSNGT
jgi:hypothetical protein